MFNYKIVNRRQNHQQSCISELIINDVLRLRLTYSRAEKDTGRLGVIF